MQPLTPQERKHVDDLFEQVRPDVTMATQRTSQELAWIIVNQDNAINAIGSKLDTLEAHAARVQQANIDEEGCMKVPSGELPEVRALAQTRMEARFLVIWRTVGAKILAARLAGASTPAVEELVRLFFQDLNGDEFIPWQFQAAYTMPGPPPPVLLLDWRAYLPPPVVIPADVLASVATATPPNVLGDFYHQQQQAERDRWKERFDVNSGRMASGRSPYEW
jgi:hypothetical protein